MAGERIQLIVPQGGGGQEPAKPPQAPDYVHMFNETIRTALEPAKFNWEMFAKREELGNQLTELQQKADQIRETSRANQARELNEQLNLALRNREYSETIRSNAAREKLETDRNSLEWAREKETERKNAWDENRDSILDAQNKIKNDSEIELNKAKAKSDAAEAAKSDAVTTGINQHNDEVKEENDAIKNFIAKSAEFGPMDHYNMNEAPALQKLYQDTLSHIHTAEGKEQLERIMTEKSGVGQELTRYQDMTGWSTEAKDAYQKQFRNPVYTDPSGLRISREDRFNQAYEAGKKVQDNYEARAKWKSPLSLQKYQQALNEGKSQQEAMAIGNAAEEYFNAQIKAEASKGNISQETLKPNLQYVQKTVQDHIDATVQKNKDETSQAFEDRKAKMVSDQVQKYMQPNGLEQFRADFPGTLAQPSPTPVTPGATPSGRETAESFATRLLGEYVPQSAAPPKPTGEPTPKPPAAQVTPAPKPQVEGTPPPPKPGGSPVSWNMLPISGELASAAATPFQWLNQLSNQGELS